MSCYAGSARDGKDGATVRPALGQAPGRMMAQAGMLGPAKSGPLRLDVKLAVARRFSHPRIRPGTSSGAQHVSYGTSVSCPFTRAGKWQNGVTCEGWAADEWRDRVGKVAEVAQAAKVRESVKAFGLARDCGSGRVCRLGERS